jgi:hypothetical protein
MDQFDSLAWNQENHSNDVLAKHKAEIPAGSGKRNIRILKSHKNRRRNLRSRVMAPPSKIKPAAKAIPKKQYLR